MVRLKSKYYIGTRGEKGIEKRLANGSLLVTMRYATVPMVVGLYEKPLWRDFARL